MEVISICVGMLSTNCYIAYDEISGKGFIVDPGDDDEKIVEICRKHGVIPEAILLTHGHFDHIMAADALRSCFEIPVWAGCDETQLMADTSKNLSALWAEPYRLMPDRTCRDGEILNIAGKQIKVIATPGHTQGGVCYYIEADKILFSGDTLFRQGYGRTDFFGGSESAIMRSINGKLLVLPEDTAVYPGHGEQTDIASERHFNPAAGIV